MQEGQIKGLGGKKLSHVRDVEITLNWTFVILISCWSVANVAAG